MKTEAYSKNMEKIIKKYSQAQAWHDPKRWKPQDKPFAVIINEGNNQYSFAIATDLVKSEMTKRS